MSTTTGELTSDLYYQKRAEIFYAYSDGHVGVSARSHYRDINYEIALQDRRDAGARIEATYNFTSLLAAMIYGGHQDIQFQSIVRDDRENEAGIRFMYRPSRYLAVALEGRRTWRYSTDATQEFIENRLLCTLIYSSSPTYIPARR